GIARDIVGASHLDMVALDQKPMTTEGLKQWLVETYPELGKLSSLAVAVNSEYAQGDMDLNDTDEVAIIPPVSGG
ncbi:MAG: MoaD/ThiS family protein, partial [Flavobacteriaceae bacterium]